MKRYLKIGAVLYIALFTLATTTAAFGLWNTGTTSGIASAQAGQWSNQDQGKEPPDTPDSPDCELLRTSRQQQRRGVLYFCVRGQTKRVRRVPAQSGTGTPAFRPQGMRRSPLESWCSLTVVLQSPGNLASARVRPKRLLYDTGTRSHQGR